jgi:hypothetical protein
LLQPAWSIIRTNTGTGGVINVTNAMTAPQSFYRIRLQ